MFYADHVPTVSTQLSILASVKAATPEDRTVNKHTVPFFLFLTTKILESCAANCC